MAPPPVEPRPGYVAPRPVPKGMNRTMLGVVIMPGDIVMPGVIIPGVVLPGVVMPGVIMPGFIIITAPPVFIPNGVGAIMPGCIMARRAGGAASAALTGARANPMARGAVRRKLPIACSSLPAIGGRKTHLQVDDIQDETGR